GTLVLVGHLRLESAAPVELAAAAHRLDRAHAIGAAYSLGVARDDLVGGQRRLCGRAAGDEQQECEHGADEPAHLETPFVYVAVPEYCGTAVTSAIVRAV